MASSGSVGTLSWSAKLDSNEFKKGVRKVKKQMKEAQKSVTDSLKTMSKGFTIATGAVVGLTGALAYMTKQSAEVVNAQKILADSIGATQSEIAGMELVADSLGVSYDQLIDKMREFGGIDEFKKLADQVASAETATEQMAIAQKALGNEGLKLLPVLQQGADGLKAMEEEALKLGLALPDDKVNALTTAWGAFEKAMQMVRGLTRQLSAELGESFGKSFVLIQSLIELFRNDFINAFKIINKGYVAFVELIIEGVNTLVIPAFIAFQNAIKDVGEAIATLYNFFSDSPIGEALSNWTDDFLLFLSTIKESLAVGFVGVFAKAFDLVSFLFRQLLEQTVMPIKKILELMNMLGIISDKAFDDMIAKVDILGDAFDETAKGIKENIKEIADVLQEDLNDAVENTFEKRGVLSKKFNLDISTRLADFNKLMLGSSDSDGKQEATKVEVEEKTGGTLATAGSIEEFNLLRDQRNQELIESKKQTKLLEKIVKSPMKSAGL
jgi:hypothetical protein